jgi:hypothetical protein
MLPQSPAWFTRDSFRGTLDEFVDIWRDRPDRVTYEGRVVWMLPLEWHVGRLPVDKIDPMFCPESDRQCIRYGRDHEVPEGRPRRRV